MMKRALTALLAAGAVSISASAADLVLYFSFDNASGAEVTDDSGMKHVAKFTGAPTYVDGKYGKALQLDGKTWGSVPNHASLQITDALTMTAWAKIPAGGEGTQSIMEKGDSWKEGEYNLAGVYGGGTLLQARDLPADCADTNVGASIQDDAWHHLAGVFDGATIKLYVDGKISAERACVGKLGVNADPLFIGARGGSQRFVTGAVDELRVYKGALTAAEVATAMAGPASTAVEPAGKTATAWANIKLSR